MTDKKLLSQFLCHIISIVNLVLTQRKEWYYGVLQKQLEVGEKKKQDCKSQFTKIHNSHLILS